MTQYLCAWGLSARGFVPPSFSPPVLGRTCSQGAAPQGWAATEPHLFCFCKQPGNICSAPAEAEETQPRGQCGLAWWRQSCLERGDTHIPNPCPIPGELTELGLRLCCSSCNNTGVAGGVWMGQGMREERSGIPGGCGDAALPSSAPAAPPPPPHPASPSPSPREGLA